MSLGYERNLTSKIKMETKKIADSSAKNDLKTYITTNAQIDDFCDSRVYTEYKNAEHISMYH